MHLFNLTLPNLADNLALDEAHLLDAEDGSGGETLRFWAWPNYAVVLGAAGKIADAVDETACTADGVPLARRASGGGTVLLGPGCLVFSLVLSSRRAPEMKHIASSYRFISGKIAAALADVHPGVELSGDSDLTIGGRKFSGNAQQRKRRFILHHGTLLHGFDIAQVGRYLRLPAERPEYRADRSHTDFLMNLSDRPAELRAALARAWGATEASRDWPAERVRRLVEEKYGRDDWIRRR